MSDYVSMRSLNLRNKIMTPAVLEAYRSGNLSYKTMQDTSSPIQEIYAKTYQYLTYPELSSDANSMISLVSPQPKSSSDDVTFRVSQSILPPRK